MERHGFIRDILDVKVLVLYVMSRVIYPVDVQKIYELCYQDESLSYFDVCEAVPQLEETEHLKKTADGKYEITDKGREAGTVMIDQVAYPVAQRAKAAVERFNRDIRRDSLIRTEILPRESGDVSVIMGLDDDAGNLMTLELMAPNLQQARKLEKTFHKNAEVIYQIVMNEFLEETEGKK